MFDLRARRRAGRFSARSEARRITSLRFDPNGLQMAVGNEEGIIRLYDLRSSRPLRVKDQMNGLPILDLKYHTPVDGSPSGVHG